MEVCVCVVSPPLRSEKPQNRPLSN